jgi:hypothetical protein
MRHDAHRFIRHDAWRFLPPDKLFEHKYRPDQARVPAGNPDGGQWTDEDSAGENEGYVAQIVDEASDQLLDETIELSAAGRGHHVVPVGVYEKYDLSDEALGIFKNETTGPLWDGRSNRWDSAHRAYNDAVEEAFDEYLKANKINPRYMTAQQAQGFLGEIYGSKNPRIENFNKLIQIREIMQRLLRRPMPRE